MAEEEVVTPPAEEPKPAEPEAPVVEATQEELPLAADGEAPKEEAKAAETPAEPEPKTEEPKPDWKDRELKSKHRQLSEAKRLLKEREDELAALKALNERVAQPGETRPAAPATVQQSEVEAAAQRMLAQQRYIEDCNKTAADGEKKFGTEWRDAVQNLEVLGGFDPETMNGLLATDDSAKVLFELGKNPDNYHRIMELPLPKRIIEMGKISMQAEAPKKVSNAPPPVAPVGGRAAPAATTMPTDNDSDEKWYAWRQSQRKKRHA